MIIVTACVIALLCSAGLVAASVMLYRDAARLRRTAAAEWEAIADAWALHRAEVADWREEVAA